MLTRMKINIEKNNYVCSNLITIRTRFFRYWSGFFFSNWSWSGWFCYVSCGRISIRCFALAMLNSNSEHEIIASQMHSAQHRSTYLYSCLAKYLTYFSGGSSLSEFCKLTLLAVVWLTCVAGIVNST